MGTRRQPSFFQHRRLSPLSRNLRSGIYQTVLGGVIARLQLGDGPLTLLSYFGDRLTPTVLLRSVDFPV
jgi:hypothetical protein